MEKLRPEKITGEEIGSGTEKTVYRHKHDKEKVVGVFHEERSYNKETVNQVKGRFYLTKLLHILYPKNIPNMHLAAADPHMVVVDYVKGSPVNIGPREEDDWVDKLIIDDLDRQLINQTGVQMDIYPGNYQKDKSGNLVYVDTLKAYEIITENGEKQVHELFDKDELEEAVGALPEERRS